MSSAKFLILFTTIALLWFQTVDCDEGSGDGNESENSVLHSELWTTDFIIHLLWLFPAVYFWYIYRKIAEKLRKATVQPSNNNTQVTQNTGNDGAPSCSSTTGLTGKMLNAVKSLYSCVAACIRVNCFVTDWFPVDSGVKQVNHPPNKIIPITWNTGSNVPPFYLTLPAYLPSNNKPHVTLHIGSDGALPYSPVPVHQPTKKNTRVTLNTGNNDGTLHCSSSSVYQQPKKMAPITRNTGTNAPPFYLTLPAYLPSNNKPHVTLHIGNDGALPYSPVPVHQPTKKNTLVTLNTGNNDGVLHCSSSSGQKVIPLPPYSPN